MSHNKSPRQLENIGRNRRSVWIEPAYLITAKHGLRVMATATAETKEEAERIAAAFMLEHKAGEIVDRAG